MTDPQPYDATFDLGGLPGGDILFTDPTASSYAEPSPTAAVPPSAGAAYRPDAPTTYEPTTASAPPAARTTKPAAPTPPARWPRPGDPVPPATPIQSGARVKPSTWLPSPTPPGSTRAQRGPGIGQVTGRSGPVKGQATGRTGPSTLSRPARPAAGSLRRRARRRAARGAWPLVALLFWGVPAGIRAITDHTSDSSSSPSSESAPDQGVVTTYGDMTVLMPKSIDRHSQNLTIHIDAPTSGSYTITENGTPIADGQTDFYDYSLSQPSDPDSVLVAASDDSITVRCEIRSSQGLVVAVGEATGTLDCAYDPELLLE